MAHGEEVAAAARRFALDERRRGHALAPGAFPDPPDDAVREADDRLDDALRPERVAAASPGALRAVVPFYLDRACRAEDEEIAQRTRRAAPAGGGFEAALAFEESPSERRRTLAAWDELERALESARAARGAARDRAARAAGRASAFDLAAAADPRDPRALDVEVERDGIVPLDDAVRRAARARASRAGLDAADPAAAARLARLADRGSRPDRGHVAVALRSLGATIGEDPDGGGPALVRGAGAWDTAILPPGERPAVVLGTAGGPGGLVAALGAFGRAARAASAFRTRGASEAWASDPAFDEAASRLFARLSVSAPFRAWIGLEEDPELGAALRLEEARVPRRAWALLHAAASGAEGRDRQAAFERAAGAAVPRGCTGPGAFETRGAAQVRGAILAALLEERLMTRHGRAWFLARECGRMLREIWEAEPDETAESVAQALSLGRMTGDVLVEAFRP